MVYFIPHSVNRGNRRSMPAENKGNISYWQITSISIFSLQCINAGKIYFNNTYRWPTYEHGTGLCTFVIAQKSVWQLEYSVTAFITGPTIPEFKNFMKQTSAKKR